MGFRVKYLQVRIFFFFIIDFPISREDRVVFGSTISGRTEEFESTVGLLINTIPVAVKLEPALKV